MGERTFTGTTFSKLKEEAAAFSDRLHDAGSRFEKARAHRGEGDIRHITISFTGPDPDDRLRDIAKDIAAKGGE